MASKAALAQASAIFDSPAVQLNEGLKSFFLASLLVRTTRELADQANPKASHHPTVTRIPGGRTAREREVAGLIARGKSNRVISEEMVLSERTIERHVANIMAKLGVSTRTRIAVWVVESGLFTHK